MRSKYRVLTRGDLFEEYVATEHGDSGESQGAQLSIILGAGGVNFRNEETMRMDAKRGTKI